MLIKFLTTFSYFALPTLTLALNFEARVYEKLALSSSASSTSDTNLGSMCLR